jgi:hypothetical protein
VKNGHPIRNGHPVWRRKSPGAANDDPVVERQKGVGITPLLAHEKVELSPLNKVEPERGNLSPAFAVQQNPARAEDLFEPLRLTKCSASEARFMRSGWFGAGPLWAFVSCSGAL